MVWAQVAKLDWIAKLAADAMLTRFCDSAKHCTATVGNVVSC